jgi:hypothetical protein
MEGGQADALRGGYYSLDGTSGAYHRSVRARSLTVNPLDGETRDGEEIWRDIRGWTLPADAPSLRFVDEASAEKIPG